MLKPKDIHEVQFSRSFKGYDPDEVDKFLDRVTEDYSELYRENAELLNKLELLASKVAEFKNAEESLRAAKEKIYRMAQEVASKAKAEAAQIERDAKERAERIVIEAKRDAENQRRLYERLQLEVTRFKAKSIALFKSEIEQLNTLPDLQVDAKDELRIRADEISEEDTFSSPFVQEYTPKYVSPAEIDFGLLDSEEEKAKEEEAAALKASADPKEDFTSDYIHKPAAEGSMFSPRAKSGFTQEEIFFSDSGATRVIDIEPETQPEEKFEPAELEPEQEPVLLQEEAEEETFGEIAESEAEAAELKQDDTPEQQYEAAEEESVEAETAEEVEEEDGAEAEETVEKKEITAFDVPDEPASKPVFTVRRVVDVKTAEAADRDVTAEEIADSLPPAPEASEGRMEKGWYNETEEFEVIKSPEENSQAEKPTSEEHPKFGQLRFGSDYDIDEEDSGSRFSFFKKKK